MNKFLIAYASAHAVNLYMFSMLLHVLCHIVVILVNTYFYLFPAFVLLPTVARSRLPR